LCLKITAAVFLFGPQNQVGDGLSVAPQNQFDDATAWDTRRDLAACFVWKQVGYDFSVCLKTGGGATADGARGTIEVIASWSSRR
jgi:hypothetical protein